MLEDIRTSKNFRWHQRFDLTGEGDYSPGHNDVENLFRISNIPTDLSGKSVLDIGTTNGGAAFMAERRNASRVVAVDICDASIFGFDVIAKFLDSRVEFLKSSVYELGEVLQSEKFDYVIFWGVLYHLRHPLLALDILRQITTEMLSLETVVSSATNNTATFFRANELANDGSNWWAPSEQCLLEMLTSSGFSPHVMGRWSAVVSDRMLINSLATEGLPEYLSIGYEREISSVRFSQRNPTRQA